MPVSERRSDDGHRTRFAFKVAFVVIIVPAAILTVLTLLMGVLGPHDSFQMPPVGALRAINSGESTYSASCAAGGYATDLADLVRPPADAMQGFVSLDLTLNGVRKSGYIVTLERNRSSDVTDVGSPVKTCNGTESDPARHGCASMSVRRCPQMS
jgi:hypothetical protein